MPVSYDEFSKKLSSSGLMTLEELQEFEVSQLSSSADIGVEDLANQLVRRYKLTAFQADVLQLLNRKSRRAVTRTTVRP